jgi:hypothetical protein
LTFPVLFRFFSFCHLSQAETSRSIATEMEDILTTSFGGMAHNSILPPEIMTAASAGTAIPCCFERARRYRLLPKRVNITS